MKRLWQSSGHVNGGSPCTCLPDYPFVEWVEAKYS